MEFDASLLSLNSNIFDVCYPQLCPAGVELLLLRSSNSEKWKYQEALC